MYALSGLESYIFDRSSGLALVQFDGNGFAFCNNHLCHLNLENFLHRQPPL
jgi:hypothetical protein